jgi:hypothetical protein
LAAGNDVTTLIYRSQELALTVAADTIDKYEPVIIKSFASLLLEMVDALSVAAYHGGNVKIY